MKLAWMLIVVLIAGCASQTPTGLRKPNVNLQIHSERIEDSPEYTISISL